MNEWSFSFSFTLPSLTTVNKKLPKLSSYKYKEVLFYWGTLSANFLSAYVKAPLNYCTTDSKLELLLPQRFIRNINFYNEI